MKYKVIIFISTILLVISCQDFNTDTQIFSETYAIDQEQRKVIIAYGTDIKSFYSNVTRAVGSSLHFTDEDKIVNGYDLFIGENYKLCVVAESSDVGYYDFTVERFPTARINSAVLTTENGDFNGLIDQSASTITFFLGFADDEGSISFTTADFGVIDPLSVSTLDYGANEFSASVVSNDGKNSETYSVLVNRGFVGGTGLESSPFLISSAEQFQFLDNTLLETSGKYFKIASNLDFSGIEYDPVGISSSRGFAGSLDGNYKTIANIEISGSDHYLGLFYQLKPGSTVKNLILDNINLSGGDCIAGLAGLAEDSVISQVKVSGSFAGRYYIGALVGFIDGSTSVDSCSVEGVVAADEYSGGLSGITSGSAEVTNSLSKVSVSGNSKNAGFISYQQGVVTSCYSIGLVDNISSDNYGFEYINLTTISSSFYDVDTSNASGSSDATGLSTANMKLAATFSGWDSAVWSIVDGDYPQLKWILNL
ncbi:MAG: hypothetical protein JXR63_01485 [Spirochaetales bacterium]|nr:hypothetical protein [Spirochaetales bacterium]